MNRSTLERLTQVIVKTTGISQVGPIPENTPLIGSGLALDSAAVVELLVGLESEFQVELLAEELLASKALTTVGTLARFIDSKSGGAG